MHRTIENDNVLDYSTGAKKKHIKLTENENIEYRSGKLYHSSGDTQVKVKRRTKHSKSTGGQKSFSDAFAAHGSYTLDATLYHSMPELDKGEVLVTR